ncbi:type I-F CRISPR-associated protein Csy1 [Teredinibacter waterburyi]|uniref:type I-F CRISPR-associated protein Csy1 n=1 Tax=Teredinibacter waterburyi TaxID=1500538 RepID=UPI00165FF491|nr:type I-F CRISPR-associated protein Csy1 [Teredinibacter waterburyi]
MNIDKNTEWSNVIKAYIESLEEGDKKNSYVDELISIYLSKRLLNAKSNKNDEQVELCKLKNKITKVKVTAAQRPTYEGFYRVLREREQIEDCSKDIAFIGNKNNFFNIWMCRSVELSEGVVPGTHIARLSHSSSTGSSFLDRNCVQDKKYMTTSALGKEIVDGTYPDAKLSKQAKFLLLEYEGNRLFDELMKGNYSVFSGLEESSEELEYWGKTYTSFLSQKPQTDFLLKQLYFPVKNNYHLLTVLLSSSLVQRIYNSHFSKDARKANEQSQKARQSDRYSDQLSIRLPSVARLLVTQSQPQNVSVLNGSRGGAVRVFSSLPPTWENQIKPPVHNKSWFDRGIPSSVIKHDIEYLRTFLLRFERIDLSTKDPKKRDWLIKWGSQILSSVMFYAEGIQNLPAGWTSELGVKLKQEHQYFLDPYRIDCSFQSAKAVSDWQSVIAGDFAKWLNRKIQGKDKKFTPQPEHTKLWSSLMLEQLREHNEMVKVVVAANREEQV